MATGNGIGKYFKLNVGVTRNRKVRRLIKAAGDESYLCWHRLWDEAADQRIDGRFTGYDVEELEEAARWKGDPGKLVDSLILARLAFWEGDVLCLHEWLDHQTEMARIHAARENGRKGGRPKNPADRADTDPVTQQEPSVTQQEPSVTQQEPSPNPKERRGEKRRGEERRPTPKPEAILAPAAGPDPESNGQVTEEPSPTPSSHPATSQSQAEAPQPPAPPRGSLEALEAAVVQRWQARCDENDREVREDDWSDEIDAHGETWRTWVRHRALPLEARACVGRIFNAAGKKSLAEINLVLEHAAANNFHRLVNQRWRGSMTLVVLLRTEEFHKEGSKGTNLAATPMSRWMAKVDAARSWDRAGRGAPDTSERRDMEQQS